GFDPWAEDNWAYPVKIDPSVFAFGATLDINGRITNHFEDPFSELSQLNSQFLEVLRAKLKRFRHDVFVNNINANAFHVLGVKRMLLSKEHYFTAQKTGAFDKFKLRKALLEPGKTEILSRPGTMNM